MTKKGRPPKHTQPMIRRNFSLPQHLIEAMKQAAEVQGVSQSELVRLALIEYLNVTQMSYD